MVEHFFGDETPIFMAILKCESNLSNTAVNKADARINGYESFGIAQVSIMHHKRYNMTPDEFREYLKTPYNGIKVSYDLYKDKGSFSPWNNCLKLTYKPSHGG